MSSLSFGENTKQAVPRIFGEKYLRAKRQCSDKRGATKNTSWFVFVLEVMFLLQTKGLSKKCKRVAEGIYWPPYTCESLQRCKSIHYHNTRNRESHDIPPSKTKSGQWHFLHRTVNIWNNLDKDFKQLSLTSFKKKVENTHARELF